MHQNNPGGACLRAIELISQAGVTPSPENYHLMYRHAAGADPALAAALDGLLGPGSQVAQVELDRLYEAHVADGKSQDKLCDVGVQLDAQLRDALKLVKNTIRSNAEYGISLDDASFQLADSSDPERLSAALEGLVQATQQMHKKSSEFGRQLRESTAEIELLKQQVQELQSELNTDALTGAANRAHFDSVVNSQLARAERLGEPFCLAMVDIDYFKAFNDRFGHRAGDSALRLVATTMKTKVREYDEVCRYGGDEFALVLPNAELETATKIAERIRASLSIRPLIRRNSGENLGLINVTIGATQVVAGDTYASIVERADKCLYAAKRAGRNRVEARAGTVAEYPTAGLPDRQTG
ncbi:MAG: diguanylate cyclase [Hyphomicrobiales bacterium]|nr:diguanylate cyclase [Hyphomicrobiales bacterium]